MKEPAIVASVLGADHARLGRVVAESEAAGVDRVQWDIMDGRFVPDLCFGADVVAACRQLHRTVSGIRSLEGEVRVALTPATPLERVRHVLDQVDVVRRLIERTGLPALIEVDGACRPRPRRARCGMQRQRGGGRNRGGRSVDRVRSSAMAEVKRDTHATGGMHSNRGW
jgi:hypothetical protein